MIIFLTGATSGIGFETVKELSKSDNIIYAVGRNFKNFQTLPQSSRKKIQEINFDLNQTENIELLFSSLELENNKFDALIHCAGIEETLPISLQVPGKINDIFKINVFSTIEVLRCFSKKKYSNNGASIVLLSSVMGILGQSGKVGYCSSKAAILGLVKSSAIELVKRKIRVNCILPGIVKTEMTEKLFNNLSKENINKIEKMHPLGFGEVEDIYQVILFLISSNSRWITGQEFIVDGGYSIV
jgi:NAD(P)-dependent dehydrogenase (short-subunit alcohol dehydrogenase family)